MMLDWLHRLGLPVAASQHAGQVDQVMVLVHWLMLVLFVGWSVFFLFVLVRFRRRRQPVATYGSVASRWPTTIEAMVLLSEIILLVFFSIPAWSARVDALPAERESTVVRVVAEQFAWNVHYPGADGEFGRTNIRLVGPDNPLGLDRADPRSRDDVTAINQLHLPVGKPVLVYLSSKDVVHSFGLPQMRVKQDAIPGIEQPVWFTPSRSGQWDIACSQLCGLGHFRMRGIYTIESQADFDAWLKEEFAAAQAQ